LKKTIKLANAQAKAQAKASNRKTQKATLATTNRSVPPITQEQFDDNLREIGLIDEYYGNLKKLTKLNDLCRVKDLKGGAITLAAIGTACVGVASTIKSYLTFNTVIIGLTSLTAYFNRDVATDAIENWNQNKGSYLLGDDYKTTNFVMNMFGLGVPYEASEPNLLLASTRAIMTGMSLFTIFNMASLVGNIGATNTLGGFSDYAARIYTNFKTEIPVPISVREGYESGRRKRSGRRRRKYN